MDPSRAQLLERFKRLGFVFVMVPALIVAAVVVVGIRQVQIMSYGRMIASGLNGIGVASMGQGDSITDPVVQEHFETNFYSLVDQGSFVCITLVSVDGEVYATTAEEGCQLTARGLAEVDQVLPKDAPYNAIVHEEEVDALLVVAPLRLTPDDEPYGAVIGARPYSLIGPFMNGVSTAIAVVVLSGAMLTYTLLRLFIRKAEQEIDIQARHIDVLSQRLSASLRDAEQQSVGTLQALVAAVDAKDSYTARHSLNVADYAVALAKHMGRDDLVPQLERAGLLHDVGKIGVPETLLAKPAALTREEYASVKEHSAVGADIITMIPFLADIVPIVRHHHEHLDGSGYPDGITGDEIPLPARVLAVADAFDAMTTVRPYRKAMRPAVAVAEMVACSGTQFDGNVVEALAEAMADGLLRFRGDTA
ncbi:MAG: HD-GYP domain-containing protein [Coriobacteriia bacterium]|nr:HD-GYP domain-containing protein [Coriobacteriia bacterium]